MHFVVSGGGTGGHIFPALEIAHALKKSGDEHTVLFVGNQGGLEETLAHESGIEFAGLKTQGLVGRGLFRKVKSLFLLTTAIFSALRILIKRRPQAVIGVGGYVSAPMVIASFLLGIKRFICEQNVKPGLTNWALSKIAHRVFISFEASKNYFPKSTVVLSGNPVRAAFFGVNRSLDPNFRILIIGGSQGAKILNDRLPDILARAKKDIPNLKIRHQCGQKDREKVKAKYDALGLNAEVVTFIKDMPGAFSEHDILVSRAGATTIAEILAAGMPSILVPYQHANGHQVKNAQAISRALAARLVFEGSDFNDQILATIVDLHHNPKELALISERARSHAEPHAASTIVRHILNELSAGIESK